MPAYLQLRAVSQGCYRHANAPPPYASPVLPNATTTVLSTRMRKAVFTFECECCTRERSATSSVDSSAGVVKLSESAVGRDAHLLRPATHETSARRHGTAFPAAAGVAVFDPGAASHVVDVPVPVDGDNEPDVTSCEAGEACAVRLK